jgi:amino acid transporter
MGEVETTNASAPKSFQRSMKIPGVLFLTLSSVTPASSVYVIVPGIVQQAGTGAFIAMIAAAFVGVAMAYVYAELASAFPLSGGEYAMYGRTLGPIVTFSYLGMYTIGCTLGPSVLALGASSYINAIFPWATPLPTALAIVGLATLCGILNVRTNAWITGIFLAFEVAALLVLAVLGAAHPERSPIPFISHPMTLAGNALAPTSLNVIALSTAVAVFAYNGFGAAVYFGEETEDAPRRIAITILLALTCTVVLELVPVAAVLVGAPNLKALIASAHPFSDFVQLRGGRVLNVFVSLGIALAIVNAVIVCVLLNARFFFSTGRDRVWTPAVDALLTRIHPTLHSPWVATLVAGGTGMATCFIPFNLLLVLSGTGIVVAYFLLCVAAIAGRRTGSSDHGVYRMPFYPTAPLFGIAALGYILFANWLDPLVGRPSLIATAAMMAASVAYYFGVLRRRGAWVLSGLEAE